MIPVEPQATPLADAVRRFTARRSRVTFTVTPAGRWLGWRVYTSSGRFESRDFFLQSRAIAWARMQALMVWDDGNGTPSNVRIKGRDGRYRDEWTYGDDPRDVPG